MKTTLSLTRGRPAARERDSLVEVLRDWLSMTNEPRAMLGVRVAKKLRLGELRPHLENLKDRIEAGKVFLPFYRRWVDEAMKLLRGAP